MITYVFAEVDFHFHRFTWIYYIVSPQLHKTTSQLCNQLHYCFRTRGKRHSLAALLIGNSREKNDYQEVILLFREYLYGPQVGHRYLPPWAFHPQVA